MKFAPSAMAAEDSPRENELAQTGPILVTETADCHGRNDSCRIAFVEEALNRALPRAGDGIDVRGYF